MAIKTRAQIQAQSNVTYIDNTVGSITPTSVRALNDDWTDSIVFLLDTGSLTVATSSVALTSIVTASFNDQTDTLTFTKGNGTSFSIVIPDISGSLPISTGSFFVTASVSNSTITFTKGDNTTFSITVNNVQNATSASFATTASFALNAGINTGSLLVNADVPLPTPDTITFTRGDNSTFNVTINDVQNATSASYATTASFALNAGSTVNTGSLLVTASVSNATITFTKGNASTFSITTNNVQNATSASFASNATSASYATTASFLLGSVQSASFATTASYAISASFAVDSQNAKDILVYVKNSSGAQIDKGKVVRITGAVGDNPLIGTASYTNDANSANTLGITYQNIPNDSFGYVITEGTLLGVDTSGYTAGQLIYLGANGAITGSAPVAPLHAVRLGEVLRVQLNNGSIYVRVDNGYELGELHDVVDTTTTGSYGDLLIKSGSVWTNSRQLTGSYGLTGSLNGGILNVSEVTASNALITNNLRVQGTASFAYTQTITGSAVIIGDQFIVLNANPPLARYAGIQVYDSGSALTASFEWDGNSDNWIVVEETGLSAGILTGPTGSKGSEVFPSVNTLIKGTGHHTVSNSQITDDGIVVKINEDTQVTGSLNITGSQLQIFDGQLLVKGTLNAPAHSLNPPSIYLMMGTSGSTATAVDIRTIVTESLSEAGRGGNLIMGTATSASTGSFVVTGSQNIFINNVLGNTNTQTLQGRRLGFVGSSNIIGGRPFLTGSQVASAILPSISNTIFQNDGTFINNTGGIFTLSNSGINAAISATLNSGSTMQFTNTQLQGSTTVTSNWSGSTSGFNGASIIGSLTVDTANISTGPTGTNLITNQGIIVAGTSNRIHIPSGSSHGAQGGLRSSTLLGSNLSVSSSTTHTSAVGLGERALIVVGSYNTNDGIINTPTHVRFAVATGTSTSARRTSLYVSASGETITSGSLIAVSGVTGSLFGTASFATNVTSASYSISSSYAISSSFATSASYALTASFSDQATTASYVLNAVSSSFATTASYATTASFINPLNQTVVITGSVQANVVSSSISSNTSSLDFSTANFFTSLVSGSTFFNVTNVKAGQTVNVLLTTSGIATASFSSNIKQISGSVYTPTSGSNKKDILTFASWDNSDAYLVSVKNLI